MTKLSLLGSILSLGGVVGAGGLALEFSKPESQTNLSLNKDESLALETPRRCRFYHIQDSSRLTVSSMAEEELRRRASNSSTWERLNRDCYTRERIFVATRSNQLVYEVQDQSRNWNIPS